MTALDIVKDTYVKDEDFSVIWKQCPDGQSPAGYKLQDGFLFGRNKLCIPKTSLRLQLIVDNLTLIVGDWQGTLRERKWSSNLKKDSTGHV